MRSRVIPSLQEIFYRVISRATEEAAATPVANQPGRFPVVVQPQTRIFLEAQAKALGASIAGVAGAILDGVAATSLSRDGPTSLDAISERFFLAIKEHRLSVPAAAELLAGVGIPLEVFSDPLALKHTLNGATLRKVAEVFHVKYDWLVGKSSNPNAVELHAWYKNSHEAATRLLTAARTADAVELLIVVPKGSDLVNSKDDDDWSRSPHFIPILVRTQVLACGESFTSYEVWEEGRWSYWRCRHDIKLVFHFASLLESPSEEEGLGVGGFALNGHFVDLATYEALRDNLAITASLLEEYPHVDWYPRDFIELDSGVAKDPQEWKEIRADKNNKTIFDGFQALLKRGAT